VRSFFGMFIGALYVLFGLREMGLSPLLVGLSVGIGGISNLAGTLLVERLTLRLGGAGRTMVTAMLVGSLTPFLIALAPSGPVPGFVALVAAQSLLAFLVDIIHPLYSVNALTLWQVTTPPHLLSRVNATLHVVEAVVTRLTDALLVQALRQCIMETDRVSGGCLITVNDPLIARALRVIREQPDCAWTVPRTAAAVSMSRSTLAERFRAATGETPMQNLTCYRMARAAEYLRGSSAGVREIGRLVGYDSEVSVTKAFRRQFGTSPGAYRKVGVLSDSGATGGPS